MGGKHDRALDGLADRALLRRAVEVFGEDAQIDMVVEELSELTVALLHFRRGRATVDQVIEEVADVSIMLGQLREVVGPALVDRYIEKKLARLESRIRKKECT